MIDLHAHVVLESALGAAGPYGPALDEGDIDACRLPCFSVGEYQLDGISYRNTPFMELELRLARMDELGIDLQVLSPNPLTFFAHIEPQWALPFSSQHNDGMAQLVAAAPTRLKGLAQLPVQDIVAAVAELRRSINDLGLVGAYLPTDLGRPLDDSSLDELYAAFVELDVPLLFHPSPDGIDRPRRDERLSRFDGDLWLGFAYEETIAVTSIVLGGVLDRHPGLDICISHGGGATSVLAERMEHAARTRPWGNETLREPGAVTARLRRLWWDSHVGGPNALRSVMDTVGTDHLVGGTNMAGWDASGDPSHGDSGLAATMDANARSLLRLN